MKPSAERKQFVIGIGSQRAGTTLLHEVIEACTSVYMHPVKELHYFDTLQGVRSPDAVKDFSRRQLQRELERIVAADDYRFMTKRYKNYLRANFILLTRSIHDVDYLDLFRPCLAGNAVLGEITPEYMALPEAGVQHMAQVVGEDARIILVARNPVARVLSSFKLFNVYNGLKLDPAEAEARLGELVGSESTWIQAQDRLNAYQEALELYGRHFKNLLLLRYDDFVENPERIRTQLEAFLGEPIARDRIQQVLGNKKNELGSSFSFSPAMTASLESRYRASAQFLAERFGAACLL